MKSRRLRRCRLWVEELEGRWVPSAVPYDNSTNWSGYAVQARYHAVSSVAGSWQVPTAHSDVEGYSSTWIGIDGFASRTVEQVGTESDFVDGQAQYYAWYEMYPLPSVTINAPVQPGDQISAS